MTSQSFTPTSSCSVDPRIFRTYDVRGRVNKGLDEDVVESIGRALAVSLQEAGETALVMGRDGRLSSELFSRALARGLATSGIQVLDVGEVTTPMVYYAAAESEQTSSCAIITGSHNPADFNGIKFVVKGLTLYGPYIQTLLKRIQTRQYLPETSPIPIKTLEIFSDYQSRIVSDISLKRRLKVVVDAGNGVAGAYAPSIFRALGCEVVELFCDVDGHFPNHHPDPAKPGNLEDLCREVIAHSADIGIAFDGDGDRCGVVDNEGRSLYADRQLMLYAADVLSRAPGSEIIYDIKCTALLPTLIESLGGIPTLWKTGHSYMKLKMQETGAALGGEVSGHMFFKERWYGFDDGIYSAARMLEILAGQSLSAAELFDTLPEAFSTPEIDLPFEEGEHYAFFNRFSEKVTFEEGNVSYLDGIRVDFEDGWGLIRPSNTSSVIVLRFEGNTPEALARIKRLFHTKILSVSPTLSIPF